MNEEVHFDIEDQLNRARMAAQTSEKEPRIVSWLVQKGVVKTNNQARNLVATILIVVIIGSLIAAFSAVRRPTPDYDHIIEVAN